MIVRTANGCTACKARCQTVISDTRPRSVERDGQMERRQWRGGDWYATITQCDDDGVARFRFKGSQGLGFRVQSLELGFRVSG